MAAYDQAMQECPEEKPTADVQHPGAAAIRLAGRVQAIRNGRRSQYRPAGQAVGSFLPEYYRRTIAAPCRKMERLIEAWDAAIPGDLAGLTALDGITRNGRLTVRVSGMGVAYQLRRLIASGLDRRLNAAGMHVPVRSIRVIVDPALGPEPPLD